MFTGKMSRMKKLTVEDVLKIYQLSWNVNFTLAEVARKYGISKGYAVKIKHGSVYGNITGHQKGVIPTFAHKQKNKSMQEMSIHQKITILMKGQEAALLIDDRYWNLFELFGQEIAEKFKHRIYETRGALGRKLSTNEVDGLYEEFKNHENGRKYMIMDTTKSDCILDLTMSYGRFAGYKMSNACNEREHVLGRKLQREEIIEEYRAIDEELCRTCLTRAGK